jgi:glutamine synthetase
MGEVRAAVDGLETLVDEASWPLPTYQELLFVR